MLERPLHHGPTRGGAREDAKYRDWYARTLESYARVFGQSPPADVWPDPDARFRHAAAFRRVDTAAHWVVRRPSPRPALHWGLPALAGTLALAACAEASLEGPLAWLGETLGVLLWIPVILVAVVVGLVLVPTQQPKPGLGSLERTRGRSGGKDGPDGPDGAGMLGFGGFDGDCGGGDGGGCSS